jgi:hypothetical protein
LEAWAKVPMPKPGISLADTNRLFSHFKRNFFLRLENLKIRILFAQLLHPFQEFGSISSWKSFEFGIPWPTRWNPRLTAVTDIEVVLLEFHPQPVI